MLSCYCRGFSPVLLLRDCRDFRKAMIETFEAYNIKSHLIIHHQIHLEEGTYFWNAFLNHPLDILYMDFYNGIWIMWLACLLSLNGSLRLCCFLSQHIVWHVGGLGLFGGIMYFFWSRKSSPKVELVKRYPISMVFYWFYTPSMDRASKRKPPLSPCKN